MKTAIRSLLLVVLAVPAYAQDYVGGGNALDNNLQVGSGGVNRAAPTPDFNHQNNIVTGNVGGLDRLHVDVPYRAPGEFNGNLSSNRLFRFQARSVPTGPTDLGGGAPRAVYRSGQSATIDELRHGASGSYLIPRDAGAAGGYQQLAPSGIQRGPMDRDQFTPGETMIPQGRRLQLNASPLMGVRMMNAEPAYDGGAPAANRDNPQFNAVPEFQQTFEDGLQTRPDAAEPRGDAGGEDADGVVDYGVDHQQQPHQVGDAVTTIERQMEILESRLDTARDSMHAERGQDLYMRLLGEVEKNRDEQRTTTGMPQQGPPADQLVPRPEDEQQQDGRPRDPDRPPMPGRQFDQRPMPGDPGEQQPREGEGENDEDGQQQRRFYVPRAGNDGRDDAAAQSTDEDPGDPLGTAQAVDELAKAVDYDLPAVDTLAAPTEDDINAMLRTAEREMAENHYFDAEATYRTVQRLRPNDPMPRVGRIHAQIGVGMVRSSAYNLRRLFLEHPELIAARYESNLLPNAERLEWVRGELQAMMEDNAGDAGLMLAYLAYQAGDMNTVREGLQRGLEAKPNDPVLLLLQRVWLKSRVDAR